MSDNSEAKLALALWIDDTPVQGNIISLRDVVEPRRQLRDYQVGEIVEAPCRGFRGSHRCVLAKIGGDDSRKLFDRLIKSDKFADLVKKYCPKPVETAGPSKPAEQSTKSAELPNQTEPKAADPEPAPEQTKKKRKRKAVPEGPKNLDKVAEDLLLTDMAETIASCISDTSTVTCNLNQEQTQGHDHDKSTDVLDKDPVTSIIPQDNSLDISGHSDPGYHGYSDSSYQYTCQSPTSNLREGFRPYSRQDINQNYVQDWSCSGCQKLGGQLSTLQQDIRTLWTWNQNLQERLSTVESRVLLPTCSKPVAVEEAAHSVTSVSAAHSVTSVSELHVPVKQTYNGYTKDQLVCKLTGLDYSKAAKLLFRMLFRHEEYEGRSLHGSQGKPALEDANKLEVIYDDEGQNRNQAGHQEQTDTEVPQHDSQDLDREISHEDSHNGQLETEISHEDSHNGQLDREISHKDSHHGQLETEISHKDSHNGHLDTEISHEDSHNGHLDTDISHHDSREASLDKEPSELSFVRDIIEAAVVRQPSESSLTKEPTDVSLPAYDNLSHPDLPPEYSRSSPNLVVAAPGIPFDEKRFDSDLHTIESEERKRDVYTPALPKAKRLEETMYRSPASSPTPTDDTTVSSQDPLDRGQANTKVPVYSQDGGQPPMKAPAELGQEYGGAGVSTVTTSAVRPNQVSPATETAVQQSELRQRRMKNKDGQWLSRDDSKKLLIFGADGNTDGAGVCGWLLYLFSILLIIITCPFSLVLCIKVVQEYERAVIFRLGRLPLGGAKGPGIFFIIPCIESYTKVDLRTVSFDVPPQEVLTKDSVTVSVDAVVYYRVSNPTVSVANVENAHHSTRLLAQTTLRNNMGTRNMTEILSDRESISHEMQSTLDEATSPWGIKVERVEIKDVRLPVQLQRAMAAEAEATREARAKVIAAEGEQNAARALKNAADIMTQSGAALQLRYLQTLSTISAEKNSTIIFPLPIDLLSAFVNRGKS